MSKGSQNKPICRDDYIAIYFFNFLYILEVRSTHFENLCMFVIFLNAIWTLGSWWRLTGPKRLGLGYVLGDEVHYPVLFRDYFINHDIPGSSKCVKFVPFHPENIPKGRKFTYLEDPGILIPIKQTVFHGSIFFVGATPVYNPWVFAVMF